MADFMYCQVKKAMKNKISAALFVAFTCIELTAIDNGSWICIHAYVVENYVRIPYLIFVQHLLDGKDADSLIVVIMKALECGGDLTFKEISRKLICLGANGVSIF